ncbi:MAG: hypothetical protein COA43_04055 [Robiginitomaculum sp.]|nr:MAG: hypothetical protein COA43_04055 [Robiginitomaculum sp.]
MKKIILPLAVFMFTACSGDAPDQGKDTHASVYDRASTDVKIVDWVQAELQAGKTISYVNALDDVAADFVQLALHMGRHDPNFVDAYHGPSIWADQAKTLEPNAQQLTNDIATLRKRLGNITPQDAQGKTRKSQLSKSLRAMATRLSVVTGETVSFDTEVSFIYDIAPPVYDLSTYDKILHEIDMLLPGKGDRADRVTNFRNSLAIPKDKLQPVFERAIAECRARTMKHFDLPKGEKFNMEFVNDKPWSGYNYYQGKFESLIQINTDFPIIIDRAVDLGCHEGYPGHHVWNLFVEQELVQNRGWIEYSVQPLFGPFGPIAEGSGNFGIKLAFPNSEKIEFERDVLFPMAGLDPSKAETLEKLNALTGKLAHATNEISRQYLDGHLTREQAIPLIRKYYLASMKKSEQRLRFVETYRGYVVNYNIGQDLAASYVKSAGDAPKQQWSAFYKMLTTPMTASDLIAAQDISGK